LILAGLMAASIVPETEQAPLILAGLMATLILAGLMAALIVPEAE
jgi:hypothetical protein